MILPNAVQKKDKKKSPHFSLLIFLVCLLFTFISWDHYLHSDYSFERTVASNLILLMGTFFSISAGLFIRLIEWRRAYLQLMVQQKEIELEQEKENLGLARQEIEILQGFIPICASCKNIRNDKGLWEAVESYVSKRSPVQFSHSICQKCRAKLYPQI